VTALLALWDRIASAVLTVNPGQWDDVDRFDVYPTDD